MSHRNRIQNDIIRSFFFQIIFYFFKGEKIKKADVTKKTVEVRNGMCTNWDDSFCLLNGRKKFYKDREIKSWEDLHKKGFQF
mgnify:CR=1 FL=1